MTPRSIRCRRISRWSAPRTSSRPSSIIRVTSVPSRRERLQRRLRHGRAGRRRGEHRRVPRALPTVRHRRRSSTAAARRSSAAGGTVAGGHTIRNPEPIFGLAVQGVIHPDRVFRKAGARPGDALVLSKPLGTGVTLAGGTSEQRGRHRRDAPAEPSRVGGVAVVGRIGGPRGHRCHRLRTLRPRVGNGRAHGGAIRDRRRRASAL